MTIRDRDTISTMSDLSDGVQHGKAAFEMMTIEHRKDH